MPRRVAVLMKSYLGDAVMAEPLLRGLQGEELFVLTSPAAREVLGHLRFDAFQPMGPRRNIFSLRDDIRALRAWQPEVALLVNRSFRSAISARLAGVPIRIGHGLDGRSFLLTRRVSYDETRYEADCSSDLGRAIGITPPDRHPRLVAEPSPYPEGTVGVQAGARYAAKRLPETAVRQLIVELEAQGRHVVLLGGGEEREACLSVATSSCTILAGECSISQTLATLAGLSGFISADTGLGHLAFGVRTPSVVVFGPTPLVKWAHGAPQVAIQAPMGDLSRINGEDLRSAFSSCLASLDSPPVPAPTR